MIDTNNVNDNKDDLAEYICSSYNFRDCNPDDLDECKENEYCDITNKLCVPKRVADNQVAGKGFVMLEHNGKKIVGSPEAISALRQKWGLATPPSPVIDYRQMLVDFYNKHNPSKIPKIDAILRKYKGHEDALMRRLNKQYELPGFYFTSSSNYNSS